MDLIKRDGYMQWLNRYRDKQVIKVITGLRRVGKSKIFELYMEELQKAGVPDDQIILINFEELENEPFREKTALYRHILSKVQQNKMLYVFLDEIQAVQGFEEVVDSLFVKPNIDVYITGSNAKFLSSEIATVLTGRYVEINVLPLSFKEYSEHYKFTGKDKRALL